VQKGINQRERIVQCGLVQVVVSGDVGWVRGRKVPTKEKGEWQCGLVQVVVSGDVGWVRGRKVPTKEKGEWQCGLVQVVVFLP
jgi:hypothetical protein